MSNQINNPANGRRLLFVGSKNGRQPLRYASTDGVEIFPPESATFEQIARQLFEERPEIGRASCRERV